MISDRCDCNRRLYTPSSLHRSHVTHLGLSDEDPVVFLAGEVALPLHGAIVLAFGLVQYDAHPFPGGEEGGADVGDGPALTFPYHLHHRADLEEEE